ncbi:hypothetical protein [Vulcanisaeta distributa]|uniref:hypothetical protein n=1 Tax=Vulcanisaeta distributa TaxID=164451 RepID=UPI0006CF6E68|nr:hypothetical protein [Vulcanisaeta distributa]
MKTSLLIAVILVVVVVAGAVAYLAISMNEGGPQSALLNAKRLLSRNVTVTYDFVIGSTFMINNIVQGVPNVPFPPGPLMGIITISRTPVDDAMVINGTLAIRHYIGSVLTLAWRFGGMAMSIATQ